MVYGYDMVIIYGMVMVHSCGYGIWLWYIVMVYDYRMVIIYGYGIVMVWLW